MKRIDVLTSEATSRREFCHQACQAASVAALGILLPGCGGSNPAGPSGVGAPALPQLSSSISNGAFTLAIDTTSPLNAVGNAALVQASGRAFLVARTTQDSFVALTATCTHAQCTITGFQNQDYVCPCHGSRYNTAGQVLSGPAPRSLAQFASAFANNLLTVTTG